MFFAPPLSGLWPPFAAKIAWFFATMRLGLMRLSNDPSGLNKRRPAVSTILAAESARMWQPTFVIVRRRRVSVLSPLEAKQVMYISRRKTALFTRRSRRGRGCMPLLVWLGVTVMVVALGRDWIGQWLHLNRPQRAEINFQSAQSAFDRGDLAAAIDYARQLLQRKPTDERTVTLLIRALVYHSYAEFDGDSARREALDLSQRGMGWLPRSLNMQAGRAYALQANGYSDEAARMALRVIKRSPEHILARIALSLSYGSQGIFEAALREAKVAAALSDQYQQYQMESQRTAAIAYGDLGQYEQAAAHIDRAIGFNRKLIPLYFERALYAMQMGNSDLASVSYFQVMAFDADNVKVRLRLCEMSSSLQERAPAIRYCGEVTELAPKWSDGWYQLGRAYFLQGDFASAQKAFHQCARLQVEQGIAIAERQFECWYLQGQSAEILGDCEALMAAFNEFLEMTSRARLPQTWSYPPGGPPICADAPTAAAVYSSP